MERCDKKKRSNRTHPPCAVCSALFHGASPTETARQTLGRKGGWNVDQAKRRQVEKISDRCYGNPNYNITGYRLSASAKQIDAHTNHTAARPAYTMFFRDGTGRSIVRTPLPPRRLPRVIIGNPNYIALPISLISLLAEPIRRAYKSYHRSPCAYNVF